MKLERTVKPYNFTVEVFYSPNCPHCRQALPTIEKYADENPKVTLKLINVEEKEVNTHLLQSFLKGESEVPLVVVNGKFLIKGDRNVLSKLTYALNLAEALGDDAHAPR